MLERRGSLGSVSFQFTARPFIKYHCSIVDNDAIMRMISHSSVEASFPRLVPLPPDNSFEAAMKQLQARIEASKIYDHKNWSFEATAAVAELTGEALSHAPDYSSISAERLALVRSRTEQLLELLLNIGQVEPLLTCVMTPITIR
jgi:hypothetical protein